MNVRAMTDLPLTGKRVLIREDLNVPVKNGAVTSDARIVAALPTLRARARRRRCGDGGVAPRGRPKEGVRSEPNSLAPVAARLGELLGTRRAAGAATGSTASTSRPGEIVLLENVRMNDGEGKDDDALARRNGRAVRHIRHGRVRHGASRAGVDARRR